MAFERIDVARARQLLDQDAVVVDIRDAASYQSGHIPHAKLITNENLADFLRGADTDKPLIVCCYHGNLSQGAADFFHHQGFVRTFSLDGGYEAWRKSFPEAR